MMLDHLGEACRERRVTKAVLRNADEIASGPATL